MKIISLLILVFLFSCDSEKSQKNKIPSPNSIVTDVDKRFLINDEDIKWRIFERNIEDTLRILRNNIFAKYGYKFKSKDLQDYYESKEWYEINPDYDNSLLTKNDSASIQTILKYENLLNSLSSDSIELLRNIFDFRDRLLTEGFDSTITVNKDITGDKNNDQFITHISYQDKKFSIRNILKARDQIIWSELHSVEPCIESYFLERDKILKNYSRFGFYYIFIRDNINTEVPRIESTPDYYVKIKVAGGDTSYEFISLLFACEDQSDSFKKYLHNFEGNQVVFPYGYCLYEPDVGYRVKVWNSYKNEFVTIWTGP